MVSLKSNHKKHNLILSFFLVILVFVCFGYISLNEVRKLGNTTRIIFSHPLVVSNAALSTNLNIVQMHRDMKDITLSNNTIEFEMALSAVNKSEHEAYRNLDIIEENILGIEGQNLERETRKLLDDWKPIRAKVIALTKDGKRDEATEITKNEGAKLVDKLEAQMKALNFYARNKAIGFMDEAVMTQKRIERLSIIGTFSGIVICIIIATITVLLVNNYENELKSEKDQLLKALEEIKTLQGILPICSYCKKIRDDKDSWNGLEEYIQNNSEAQFSHGICPSCLKENFPEQADEVLKNLDRKKNS